VPGINVPGFMSEMVANKSSREAIAATGTAGALGSGDASRAKPKPSTVRSAATKPSTGNRTARQLPRCSQSVFATPANQAIRKVNPHMPVTDTIWTSGSSPAWV
jgi:hypothetical protein